MQRLVAATVIMAVTSGLVVALAIFGSGRSSSSGPTNVSGAIASDTTWALSDSPFIVTGDIGIAPGVTLTIEPGVEVRFDGYYEILVRGTLNARGTSTNAITFTKNSTDIWNRIVTLDGAAANFEYAVLEYGERAVGGSGATVAHSILRNNYFGVDGGSSVVSSLITQNYSVGASAGIISGNDIIFNGQYGVWGGTVIGNRIAFDLPPNAGPLINAVPPVLAA